MAEEQTTQNHLGPDEMDRQIDVGFCLLLSVQDPEGTDQPEVPVYLDTSEQEMLYDPRTYTNPRSNTSVCMQFERQSPSVFRITNHVIPSAVLTPANRVLGQGNNIDYSVRFIPGATANFTRQFNEQTELFAFYTLINNNRRAYLQPVVNPLERGQRRKTMRVVLTTDPAYVFYVDPTRIRVSE